MTQLAWLWLRYRPGSARKLLVALWRYVTHGVVPEGAVMTVSPAI